jgi:phage terminase small subunit
MTDKKKRGRFKVLPGQRGRPTKLTDLDDHLKMITAEPRNLIFQTIAAVSEYERLTPFLLHLNRLADADVIAITQLCDQWGQLANVFEIALDDGFFVCDASPSWSETVAPEVAIAHRLAESFLTSCIKFGMTPLSRAADGSEAIPKEFSRRTFKDPTFHRDELFDPWTPESVDPPEWLSERSRQIYFALRESLSNVRIFCPLDVAPLSVMVCLFDLRQRVLAEMSGFTVEHHKSAAIKEHPGTRAIATIDLSLDKYQRHFALNPAARKRFKNQTEDNKVALKIYLGSA